MDDDAQLKKQLDDIAAALGRRLSNAADRKQKAQREITV
jgi:hypothetical protein